MRLRRTVPILDPPPPIHKRVSPAECRPRTPVRASAGTSAASPSSREHAEAWSRVRPRRESAAYSPRTTLAFALAGFHIGLLEQQERGESSDGCDGKSNR